MSTSLHGGNRRAFAERFGLRDEEIMDFSSNGNPLGPPEGVGRLYRDVFNLATHYPEPESLSLRAEIAGSLSLSLRNVETGNGSCELIYRIVQVLKPRCALLVEPGFSEYGRALSLHGSEIRSFYLDEGLGFEPALDRLAGAAEGADAVFLANPNNPTGRLAEKREMLVFVRAMERRGVFTVLDEAFMDWEPEQSLAAEVTDQSLFFVIRSMTKFFNLAGLRLGYGVGSASLVENLARHAVPWSVSSLAQALGLEALRDRSFPEYSRAWLARERAFLEEGLRSLGAMRVFPSRTNFVLVKIVGGISAEELAVRLAADKIMIREAGNFKGLDGRFFRVAVRTRRENLLLLAALQRVFRPQHAAA